MFTVSLTHIWTKETRQFEVETVAATYVSIRWGQSGVYDLNLLRNVLTARSQKAQRKAKPLWSATDIIKVRADVTRYLAERENRHKQVLDRDRAIARHAETMPGVTKL